MDLILASNNAGKIKEINELLDGTHHIISLQAAGIKEDIPEPFFTFKENALAKAKYAFEKTGIVTFAEDSGLVVPALNGDPGVFSARYAGEPKNDLANTQKLLKELDGIKDRDAYYTTVICIAGLDTMHYFSGKCEGRIAAGMKGNGGFGYDPVFIPDGYDQTFGQLPAALKSAISHRAKAMKAFIAFLSTL
ncbi:MAG: RdgB/HAM1 family non-canonical purine NTP pyrophosphatase [Sphingobacteriales bacterium]|nr:MAG: RdgB/HAM1 family non-canonical purine NTP pyrophosphatase [Sphingobacteriales bacterium]